MDHQRNSDVEVGGRRNIDINPPIRNWFFSFHTGVSISKTPATVGMLRLEIVKLRRPQAPQLPAAFSRRSYRQAAAATSCLCPAQRKASFSILPSCPRLPPLSLKMTERTAHTLSSEILAEERSWLLVAVELLQLGSEWEKRKVTSTPFFPLFKYRFKRTHVRRWPLPILYANNPARGCTPSPSPSRLLFAKAPHVPSVLPWNSFSLKFACVCALAARTHTRNENPWLVYKLNYLLVCPCNCAAAARVREIWCAGRFRFVHKYSWEKEFC
ncbi:hypothetical protein CEXT_168881 [Caerostris extrusa]|uniref:Uncharacterized protein n=1 Tax=Caerostris extrusa TaxID=172846 RepID=A0AAV4P8B8_CAEEX|nr:hypothetical protein CEXT_168881 [Caerostris extrusa]